HLRLGNAVVFGIAARRTWTMASRIDPQLWMTARIWNRARRAAIYPIPPAPFRLARVLGFVRIATVSALLRSGAEPQAHVFSSLCIVGEESFALGKNEIQQGRNADSQ